jgi:hypothetical protein
MSHFLQRERQQLTEHSAPPSLAKLVPGKLKRKNADQVLIESKFRNAATRHKFLSPNHAPGTARMCNLQFRRLFN